MRTLRVTIIMATVAALWFSAVETRAYDQPSVNLGFTSFMDGGPPAGPGFYFTQYLQWYTSDRFTGANGSEFQVPTATGLTEAEIDVYISLSQFIYQSNQEICPWLSGGRWGLDVIVPVVSTDLDPSGILVLSDNGGGLGDILVGPFIQWDPIMGEQGPVFMTRIEFQMLLPTGRYSSKNEINPGSNFFSFNPYWAATWFGTPRWTVTWRVHYLWNDENSDPNRNFAGANSTQAGQAVHMNFASAYEFIPKKLRVGLNGYFLKQISDTKMNGSDVPDRREQVVGLGPGLLWHISPEDHLFFNVYFETNTENRTQGQRLNLRYVRHFQRNRMNNDPSPTPAVDRQSMDVDIVCVGFGPASGGFLTTLNRALVNEDGTPRLESRAVPGMPAQVICYERADDIGFGVSGVVTRARGIRETFPDLDIDQVPLASPVKDEKVLYLLDPHGASRRSGTLRLVDRLIGLGKGLLKYEHQAVELPYIPSYLQKHGGYVFSLGQFNQWVGAGLMETGQIQVWPGTPVDKPLIDDNRVTGVRLVDQGTDKAGQPGAGYMPGMDVRAALTVVADGPVGTVGRQLDDHFGMPEGHHQHDWAVGMKMVVDLPPDSGLEPGMVLHTLGYPEPEIFGFLYVYPGNVASLGIFVPSWFDSPVRTAYLYLQHWMQHPYLWRYLNGGTLRSWGAKTLQESGRRGEPFLAGDGFARIGEGSGSTNVLTGSGVDEAWATGTQLAEAVIALMQANKPFTRDNLEATYVRRRRASWVEAEGRVAERSRDGFQRGVVTGMIGMALAGATGGKLAMPGKSLRPADRLPSVADYFRDRLPADEIDRIVKDCGRRGTSVHTALLERCGWPAIPYDGKLLVSQQDALLMGGKVQAPAGYADHVVFLYPYLCEECGTKLCVEVCSGEAITPGENAGVPVFDREKCIHCGACLWNCAMPLPDEPERTNVAFRAGAGGLHSAEN